MTNRGERKTRGRWLTALLACLLSLAVATSALAAPGPGRGKAEARGHGQGRGGWVLLARFRDAAEARWALAALTEMNIRAVLQGYPDGTIRPNKPVTRQEAVTMLVRYLHLDVPGDVEEADLPFADADKVAPWARASIAAAWRAGVLSEASLERGRLQPNKPADRAWLAQLIFQSMLRAGVVDEADLESFTDQPPYVDWASIPALLRPYVLVATLQHWFEGFPDRTFRGHKPVTRAQLAMVLHRILGDEDVDLGDLFPRSLRGQLTAVDEAAAEVTVRVRGQAKEYELDDDAAIFLDEEPAELADLAALLETHDSIPVRAQLTDEGTILFLGARTPDEDEDEDDSEDADEQRLRATIDDISRPDDADYADIRVELAAGGTASYRVEDDVEIEFEGDELALDDLRVGDEIVLVIEDGEVESIEVRERAPETREVEGRIVGLVIGSQLEISLENEGDVDTYAVSDDVEVTIDGEEAGFADLAVGDDVTLQLQGDTVLSIEAER